MVPLGCGGCGSSRCAYAGAALRALLDEAAATGLVCAVRATVSPDNRASQAVVRRAGLIHVGEQVDEVDGLELVFERELAPADRMRRTSGGQLPTA